MRRIKCIHESESWPRLEWDEAQVGSVLAPLRYRQGVFVGALAAFGPDFQSELNVETVTQELLASSAIEGERYAYQEVRSSVAERAGLKPPSDSPSPRREIDGFVRVLWDISTGFMRPLTETRLLRWHRWLFPSAGGEAVGRWRDESSGAMRVVSGASFGDERVHFEAPAASRVEEEMRAFLEWFETNQLDPILAGAVAHLWFLTIHPFEDGNGRIARAISELCLARADQRESRFYSLSRQIEAERSDYYDELELAQKGTLDVTDWVLWFLQCLDRAIGTSEQLVASQRRAVALRQRLLASGGNARQCRVLEKLNRDFQGKLTSSKYAKLAKCSQDTALRDLKTMVGAGILVPSEAGGRSQSYALIEPQSRKEGGET